MLEFCQKKAERVPASWISGENENSLDQWKLVDIVETFNIQHSTVPGLVSPVKRLNVTFMTIKVFQTSALDNEKKTKQTTHFREYKFKNKRNILNTDHKK